jgi:hypothetical protein
MICAINHAIHPEKKTQFLGKKGDICVSLLIQELPIDRICQVHDLETSAQQKTLVFVGNPMDLRFGDGL